MPKNDSYKIAVDKVKAKYEARMIVLLELCLLL
jgi:hypothetical protein